MRTVLLFAFVFFAIPAFCQQPDSLAIVRDVDSLLQQVVKNLILVKGAYAEAYDVALLAERKAEKAFGRESALVADCLNAMGTAKLYARDLDAAEPLIIEAKNIWEKKLGREDQMYAWGLANLAMLYSARGRYAEAVPLLIEAKEIRLKVLGNEAPEYAMSLNNLATVYFHLGRYVDTETLLLESIGINLKTEGGENADYALGLNNLAFLYKVMGRYSEAERLYLQASTLFEKTLGRAHPEYAMSLNNLAALYFEKGRYAEAEPLFIEAKDIREKALGHAHPDYAESLNNLASLHKSLGRYAEAEQLSIEVNDLWEKSLGRTHPRYALGLSNLGTLYYEIGRYTEAEKLYKDAANIEEKVFGRDNSSFALTLSNLALLYQEIGRYQEADSLFVQAEKIREKTIGAEHPDNLTGLNNHALLYYKMGRYEEAESLFVEIKLIMERVLGQDYPRYAQILYNLATLYHTSGRYAEADLSLKQAESLQHKQLVGAACYLSDKELKQYADSYAKRSNALFSFLFQRENTGGNLTEVAFDNTLFFKGFLQQSAATIKLHARADTATSHRLELLADYRRRLGQEYLRRIEKRNRLLLEYLEPRANALEKELARMVGGYEEAFRVIGWNQVQARLLPDEAAFEFVHFRYITPDNRLTDSTMYAALILRSGDTQPRFIPLFEEKSLDSLLERNTDRNELYVKRLYSLADRSATPLGKPQKSLYDLLWKPLEKELAGVKTIYFSPSGLLHRLNLAAVPINLDSVLGDRYRLIELGSTRQLAVPTAAQPAASDAALFGGIQYDSKNADFAPADAAPDSVSIVGRGELSFAYTDSTLRIGTWSALPFTDREVGSVEKTLKATGFQTSVRRGYAASEEAFKSIGNSHGVTSSHPVTGSPRVLHIATHGYFFPDPKLAVSDELMSDKPQSAFKISDHPMIRSGLILSGANHAWQTGKPIKEGMEDGILTAYEISQMNLSNTELVVLSACETGLGDIQGNEGVYGLQRAFKIAGAKYLIMSLWKVDDRATMQFMELFYRKWLEDKLPIPEAFRATQADMRERWLGQPYLWAGFVLVE